MLTAIHCDSSSVIVVMLGKRPIKNVMITPVIELDYSPEDGGKIVERNNGHDVAVNGSWVCNLPPKMGKEDVVNHCEAYGLMNDSGEVVIKTCEPRIENEYMQNIGL